MLNNQPIEKSIALSSHDKLYVNSIFPTIQGEGPLTGTPSVFVRLAGCNLQCPLCDTEYTDRTTMTAQEVVQVVKSHRESGLVVITGGEPFRQNLRRLFYHLIEAGYYVQVETNGTLAPPQGTFYSRFAEDRAGVSIVCSPKTGKLNPLIARKVSALKYVVKHGDIDPTDGLPIHALDHSVKDRVARPPRSDIPVYVQPADEKDDQLNERNLRAAIASCMAHGYRLQIQLHKVIGME